MQELNTLYRTKQDNTGLNRVIQDYISLYRTKPDYVVYLGVNSTRMDYA